VSDSTPVQAFPNIKEEDDDMGEIGSTPRAATKGPAQPAGPQNTRSVIELDTSSDEDAVAPPPKKKAKAVPVPVAPDSDSDIEEITQVWPREYSLARCLGMFHAILKTQVQQGGDPRKVDRKLFFKRYFPEVHYVRNTLKLKLDWFTAVYEAKGEQALATWHGKQDDQATFAVFQTKFARYKV
jgi:hypothetical protein